MKRDATQTIWRTVVFAGAMLGAPACSKKQPQTTPSNTTPATTEPAPADPASATPAEGPTADPCAGAAADPCAARPGPQDPCEGGGMGRGFVLS